jgi:hypothetical protein
MNNNQGNNEYRNSLIMRFVLIYVISILFAVIPLYFLFNIPDVAKKELSASKLTNAEQMKTLMEFDELIAQLDSGRIHKAFDYQYTIHCSDLVKLAENKLGKSNLYRPYFVTIANLYTEIANLNDVEKTKEAAAMKAENEKLTKALDDAINELKIAIAGIPSN